MELFFSIKMSGPFGHYCSCCFVFTGDDGMHPSSLLLYKLAVCLHLSVCLDIHQNCPDLVFKKQKVKPHK